MILLNHYFNSTDCFTLNQSHYYYFTIFKRDHINTSIYQPLYTFNCRRTTNGQKKICLRRMVVEKLFPSPRNIIMETQTSSNGHNCYRTRLPKQSHRVMASLCWSFYRNGVSFVVVTRAAVAYVLRSVGLTHEAVSVSFFAFMVGRANPVCLLYCLELLFRILITSEAICMYY